MDRYIAIDDINQLIEKTSYQWWTTDAGKVKLLKNLNMIHKDGWITVNLWESGGGFLVYIEFEIIDFGEPVVIELDYNGDYSGKAIYNAEEDSFSYTDKIDEKINSWRPILWLERRMRHMINNKKDFDIYAIG